MKSQSHDPTQPLPCARKEKYCQLRAVGQNMSEAYANSGFKPHGGNARRLSQNELILSRIEQIRSEAAENARMKKADLIEFLESAIKTDVNSVDEKSRLAQEVTTETLGKGVLRKKVKMVGKIDAAKLLAVLTGWNAPEKAEHKIEVVITKTW